MSLIPPTRTPTAVLRSVACGMGEQVGLSEQVFWFSEWNACPELRRRSVWRLIEAKPIHTWRQASKETAPSVAGKLYPASALDSHEGRLHGGGGGGGGGGDGVGGGGGE